MIQIPRQNSLSVSPMYKKIKLTLGHGLSYWKDRERDILLWHQLTLLSLSGWGRGLVYTLLSETRKPHVCKSLNESNIQGECHFFWYNVLSIDDRSYVVFATLASSLWRSEATVHKVREHGYQGEAASILSISSPQHHHTTFIYFSIPGYINWV